jgi:signal transduction histidine kinase
MAERGDTSGSELRAPLWRAIAVYRIAALVYVTVLVANNFAENAHPMLTWVALVVIAAWTVLTTYAYRDPARRRWPLLVADLVIVIGVMLASVPVVGRAALEQGRPTLAVAWHVAPVLAWAVSGGKRRGVVAALAMGATDLLVRWHFDQSALTGATLLLLAAIAVGHLVRLVDAAELRMQRAVELEAATRERERLARHIHDSVLQVLALVKRRGESLDGEAGELARLAGEQEAALRALVTTTHAPTTQGTQDAAEVDLMALLGPYASSTVSIASPAGPVPLPGRVAGEIAAAVGAALDNVARHCPPDTRAFVLVEDEPQAVTVSVRDDGCGMSDDRLTQAERQGRLGVAQSIRGRVADLGGEVRIVSAPDQGTEVELRVPRGSIG